MKEARVVLLEVHSPSSLTSLVQEILESSAQPAIQLRRESGFEDLGRVTQFDPHLIILTLSSNYLKELDALILLLENKRFTAPVIAVIDGDNADEIIRLLKAGIIDFITPPLKTMEVLPRIWRLLTIEGNRSPRVQGFSYVFSRMEKLLGYGHVPDE